MEALEQLESVLAAVPLTPEQQAVQQKIAMAGLNAELTPAEFAAYRGKSVRSVRRNLKTTPGVCRTGRNSVGIHLGTYLKAQER